MPRAPKSIYSSVSTILNRHMNGFMKNGKYMNHDISLLHTTNMGGLLDVSPMKEHLTNHARTCSQNLLSSLQKTQQTTQPRSPHWHLIAEHKLLGALTILLGQNQLSFRALAVLKWCITLCKSWFPIKKKRKINQTKIKTDKRWALVLKYRGRRDWGSAGVGGGSLPSSLPVLKVPGRFTVGGYCI